MIHKLIFITILFPSIFVSLFLFETNTAHAACTEPSPGGSLTISSSCVFSGTNNVHGVDNGGMTINNGVTLTVAPGQTIVWGPGQSIVINGVIVINDTGQLKQTRIWMLDSDTDGYPSTTTQEAEDNQGDLPGGGVGYRNRADLTSFMSIDFDDSSAAIFPGTKCAGVCTVNSTSGSCDTLASGSDPGGTPLSASITSGSCANTTVFRISGTTNAHAELQSQSNYTNYACVSGTGLGNSCTGNFDTALKLSGATNAHGEKKTESNYASSACLSTTNGTIVCSYATDCSTLGSLYTCLASISSDTNAHVGNCSAYSTKVCCANVCP